MDFTRVWNQIPAKQWVSSYTSRDLRPDLSAGLTVGAMLVPQAMAYALLAGLPPEVGLYAATIPVLVYAVLGTSRQLAVGPVAIVSLLTASALAPMAEQGGWATGDYVAAAAVLAVLVGVFHLIVGGVRLGFLVNLLSHSVLVGFTAAAAIIIGFSQAKHVLGVDVERSEHFYQAVMAVGQSIGQSHLPTVAVGVGSIVALLAAKRLAPRVPAALLVVVGSILISEALDLRSSGVSVVGDIPGSLPTFDLPGVRLGLIGALAPTAAIITLVGFMESIAVAKVYARRHRYQIDANRELISLGAANVASGLFGGYPVTGGFSRTAVNDAAGARTPLASVITAGIVLATIAFLTPLLASLPNAALGAIIMVAVVGLVDVAEMRHIATVKRSDLISLAVAFFGTLALGIELGIAVAVVASMLVVFARLSMPHTAVLGRVEGTTTYRNTSRFPEAVVVDGIRIVRVDAPLAFVNADTIKRFLLTESVAHNDPSTRIPTLVLDASGINDGDATGVELLSELVRELDEAGTALHLADVKGPLRDVLWRAGLWQQLEHRIHASTHEAVTAVQGSRPAPADQRRHGIDERSNQLPAQKSELVTT